MSEWQKVRVRFTDAGGNEVSAVMWTSKDTGWLYNNEPEDDLEVGMNIRIGEKVKVEEIRELPTGVGAVIRVSDYGSYMVAPYGDLRDIFTTDASGQWWSNTDGDVCPGTQMHDWEYEILSEGIQL